MAEISLSLNDRYRIPNAASGKQGLQVRISKLGINTEFFVTGNAVQNPDVPREMPTLAFVRWLQLNGARKITR